MRRETVQVWRSDDPRCSRYVVLEILMVLKESHPCFHRLLEWLLFLAMPLGFDTQTIQNKAREYDANRPPGPLLGALSVVVVSPSALFA